MSRTVVDKKEMSVFSAIADRGAGTPGEWAFDGSGAEQEIIGKGPANGGPICRTAIDRTAA